jgi:hypothetical protein
MEPEKRDPKYWLQKVREEGMALKFVPETMKTEAVCLSAVRQDGWELQDVPRKLQTINMCRAAVRQNAYVIDIVPASIKSKVKATLGIE